MSLSSMDTDHQDILGSPFFPVFRFYAFISTSVSPSFLLTEIEKRHVCSVLPSFFLSFVLCVPQCVCVCTSVVARVCLYVFFLSILTEPGDLIFFSLHLSLRFYYHGPLSVHLRLYDSVCPRLYVTMTPCLCGVTWCDILCAVVGSVCFLFVSTLSALSDTRSLLQVEKKKERARRTDQPYLAQRARNADRGQDRRKRDGKCSTTIQERPNGCVSVCLCVCVSLSVA